MLMAIVSFLFHPIQFIRDWRNLRTNSHYPYNEKSDNMKWFGEALGPYAVPEKQINVASVIGWECFGCEKVIIGTDSGMVLPTTNADGETGEIAIHQACMVNSIIGPAEELGELHQTLNTLAVDALDESEDAFWELANTSDEDVAFEDIKDDPFTSTWHVIEDDMFDGFVIGTADKPLSEYLEEGPEEFVCELDSEGLAHYIADMHNDRLAAKQQE